MRAVATGSASCSQSAWLLDVFVHHGNGLALCDKKPSATEGHHRVPSQAMHRSRHLNRGKALPAIQSVSGCGFLHIARNRNQRMVKSKRHVPDLSGEDRENACALDTEEAARKKRHESRHRGRKKAKHRY